MFGIFFILIGLVKCNILLINSTLETMHILPANDLDHYIKYASHIFFPNRSEPLLVGIFFTEKFFTLKSR
jgi:hypothetical protein